MWGPRARARRIMGAHLRAVSALAARPLPSDRFLRHGSDPLRILLVGNGIALGFGVRNRSDTLDGQIGARLADATGRGVVVNNWTHDTSRLHQQALNIVAGMTLQSEHVVVWCPSYHELLDRPTSGHWRSALGVLVSHISPTVTIVVNAIPLVESSDFDARGINMSINRINRAVRRRVERHPNVVVCTPAPVSFVIGSDRLYDEDYYARLGEQIAAHALATLTARSRHSPVRSESVDLPLTF